MNMRDVWLALINFVLLPILFLLLAFFMISAIEMLEEKLPEHSAIKIWLKKPRGWKNPLWLRDRIDMVFSFLIVIVLIVVTVIYS
jgi:hypothetical protein